MTTGETELTFIRCPNCRSLVPAVATKCKMCGNFFGDDGDEPMDQSGTRKSRVRQRTVTVEQGDIAEMKAELGREESPSGSGHAAFPEQDSFSMATEEFASALDRSIEGSPEDAEDLEATTLASAPVFPSSFDANAFPSTEESSSFAEPVENDEASGFGGSFRDASEDEASFSRGESTFGGNFGDPFPSQEPLGSEPEEAATVASPEDDSDSETLLSGGMPNAESSDEEAPAAPKKKRRRRRRKKKAATEASEENQNNGHHAEGAERLSHAGGEASDTEEEEDALSAGSEESAADVEESQEVESQSYESDSASEEEVDSKEDTKVEENSEKAVMASQEEEISGKSSGRGRSQRNSRDSEATSEDAGMLLGWFVNYAQDAQGFSIEIRSGRYFIGRKSLREDDVVIPDTAISTPHCLVTASKDDGVQIQDLMSEQGTFIKRKGSNSFVQIQDTVDVQHGDCVRFGAYEAVVCLVP